MKHRGFTLVELVLVISILGIVAASALPRFLSLGAEAETSSRAGVVDAVRTGIALYRANNMVTNGGNGIYPTTLDNNGDDTVCTTCFSNVLASGINDASWRRIDSGQYRFWNGASNTTYLYLSNDGTFNPQ